MNQEIFTVKEKYHISATICALFFILSLLFFIMPQWITKAYALGVIVLFWYIAWRNLLKVLKSEPKDV